MQHLTYDKDQFYLYNAQTARREPLRILSGALHYFRVPRALWRDRLLRLRAMGLNTVETYVAWNVHEPEPGRFDFSGGNDLGAFLDEAAALGLHALVRPGPYICAEWEFGGFPAWLLREPMELRTGDPRYLRAVDRFFDALVPVLVPRLHENGGTVIGVQVENEYGSYGADKAYLLHLRDGLRRRGVCGCLFTSDGPGEIMLTGGKVEGAVQMANFGSGGASRLPLLRAMQPDAPLMCCEYWDGWFDHWLDRIHHTRAAADAAAGLDEILAMGGSANLYMFCGGTNFGFMSGANWHETTGYLPTTTSYDYDAPLTEGGDYTEKYHAMREVIAKYAPVPQDPLPPPPPKRAYGPVLFTQSAGLFDQLAALSRPVQSPYPLWMEDVGQNYGFILYRARVHGPMEAGAALVLKGVRDRALVFVDGEYRGSFYRQDRVPARVPLALAAGESAQVDILVENMGRFNYGWRLSDNRKGLEAALLEFQRIPDWEIYPLPLGDLSGLCYGEGPRKGPAFLRGTFSVEGAADTYLYTGGMGKGVAYLNGFNLGRYWRRGPQQTLYIPGCLLREGENVLELFELYRPEGSVELLDHPVFAPGDGE